MLPEKPSGVLMTFHLLADDVLLDDSDVAAIFRCSPYTVKGWRLRGKGPAHVRLSQTVVRYRVGALREHLAAIRAADIGPSPAA